MAKDSSWRLLEDGRIEKSDGSIIRLSSIQLVEQKQLRKQAFALIRDLLSEDWHVEDPVERDRYGDQVAVVQLSDNRSLQTLLLKKGLARVYPQLGEGPDVSEFLAAEALARDAKTGLWKLKPYQPVGAEEAVPRRFDLRNYYQLVEGKVLDVAKVRGNIYLNFGEDWRQDFTIMIPKGFAKSVEAQGLDYKDLEGKTLRVRGWLRLYGGPLIDVTDARQIEIFD